MYTLKSIVRRGTPLVAVVAMVAATLLPSTAAFADELNPLTERSLLLSSSAPGFTNTDGSGNSEDALNASGDEFAPPGSGPNGRKSGETFSFKVSTDSAATSTPVRAFSFQYCTTAAGLCQAPGDNTGDNRTSSRLLNETPTIGGWALNKSDLNVVAPSWSQGTDPGQFQVFVDGQPSLATDWTLSVKNVEDTGYSNPSANSALTGKNNYITLVSPTGVRPAFNNEVKIVFNASTDNYITNPGSGAFFVKINTYKDYDDTTTPGTVTVSNGDIIDGGVTVANVMTDSIHITTKVLETMKFSVGTQNPDTQAVQHGSCDAMNVINGNRLDLGNPSAESSLSTEQAYDTNSYWRLSSNSSGGAVVYYSGDTLQNTVGDEIAPIGKVALTHPFGDEAHSQPGTEQFGLALVNAGEDTRDAATYTAQDEIDDPTHVEGSVIRPFPDNYITPRLDPLGVQAGYGDGDSALPISNGTTGSNGQTSDNAEFDYNTDSLKNPQPIASETTDVIPCATAKVRYVGNIAADTPAGVYTTKINYLAAPQY